MKKRMISLSLALCLALCLAIPAGAATESNDQVDTSTVEVIHDLFNNKESCQIFDRNGNNITASFLQRNQANYDQGNLSAIAKDMGDNGVCTALPTNPGIMPMIDLWTSASCRLSMTYKYNGNNTATAVTFPRIKAYVHDWNGGFISVNPAVLEKSSSGLAGATVSGGGHDIKIDGGDSRTVQQITFKVSKNGKTVHSNWTSVWWAGQSSITAQLIDQTGSL